MREQRLNSEWIMSCNEFKDMVGMHEGSVLSCFFAVVVDVVA